MQLQAKNFELVLQTPEDVRAQIEKMQPHEKTELSAAWLALLGGSISWLMLGNVIMFKMSNFRF